jgi:hypothetical protein
MKYNAPFGSADPNAAYVDRNTPGAVSGSRVPALAIEAPQREIEAVIVAAGIDPSKADMTQLLQAIGKLIDAATGGGGDENYLLMTQARSRLPIYPEVLTSDGKLPVVSPGSGTVRVPAGYNFLHRGIFNVTTVETDFVTLANKVYHLRWSNVGGFVLKDVADVAYNPGALPEASDGFDSTYDDMLVARIATNPSNTLTVTNFVNRQRLAIHSGVAGTNFQDPNGGSSRADFLLPLNWARTPKTRSYSMIVVASTDGNVPDRDIVMYSSFPGSQATEIPATRYQIAFTLLYDYTYALTAAINAEA